MRNLDVVYPFEMEDSSHFGPCRRLLPACPVVCRASARRRERRRGGSRVSQAPRIAHLFSLPWLVVRLVSRGLVRLTCDISVRIQWCAKCIGSQPRRFRGGRGADLDCPTLPADVAAWAGQLACPRSPEKSRGAAHGGRSRVSGGPVGVVAGRDHSRTLNKSRHNGRKL
jgi:hypothetical protein